MRPRRASALAILAALAAGCSSLADGPPANECASDVDCPSGTCAVERRMCVAAPPEPLSITLEIVPPEDAAVRAALPASFGPFEVSGPTSDLSLVLPSSATVRGTLRYVGEPVQASLIFTQVSRPHGAPATRIETQTFAEPVRNDDGSFSDFTVQLQPSQTYELTIQPTGEWRSRLPPLRFPYMAPIENTQRIEEAFDDYWEDLPVVEGRVVDYASGEEQPGMIVRAIDMTTSRVISSTYTTGTDPERSPGYFQLRLAPRAELWLFSINASGERIEEGRPSPTYTLSPGTLHPAAVVLYVPPVSDRVITYTGFVEVAGTRQGVPATLEFTARNVLDDETQVLGSFRAMATANETGAFTVQLLPGTYDVVITPSGTEHGVVRETVDLSETSAAMVSGQVFEVPRRARFQGTVQTPLGEPVGGAQARGLSRGSTRAGELPEVARYARSSDAVSDTNGNFALPLDIGLYDVVVEPPRGSGWPWALRRDVAIGAAGDSFRYPIELAVPVPLSGRATFADGAPVAMGEVRAYAILEDGRALQVGRAQTDAEGRFTVLLPPSP